MATSEAATRAEIHEHARHDTIVNYGFWIYLMSDVIIFTILFASFVVLMERHAGGPTAEELFSLRFVFIETMLLLFSTLTYGLAMIRLREAQKTAVMTWLAVTFALGASFVGMEIYEFYHLVAEGAGPQRSAFLSAFFTLVATHGTHVTFGLIWIATMIGQIAYKGLTAPVASRLTRLSLFWHFLDIVWVAVFSTVYLGSMY